VTDSEGHGLAGVWVGVFNSTTFNPIAATTASDGTYTIVDLPAGDYGVCVNPREATGGISTTGYLTKCYGQSADAWWDESYPIPVDSQEVSVSATTSPIANVSLPVAAAISGSISAQIDGHPVSGVIPNVYLKGNERFLDGTSFVESSSDGTYTVTGVPTGVPVIVCFDTSNVADDVSPNGYVPQCFDQQALLVKVGSIIPATATAESAAPGETVTGVNARLMIGGAIRGAVANFDGDPLNGVAVTAVRTDGSIFGPFVGDDGDYEALGLPAGQYSVCYDGSSAFVSTWSGETLYANQCYSGVPWIGPDLVPAGASTVSVSVGQNTPLAVVALAGIDGPQTMAPKVTAEPANRSVTAGQAAVFAAAAIGVPVPTVQWQVSTDGSTWTDVAGATSATITIADTTTAMSGRQYRADFTNSAGHATTTAATLTVTASSSGGSTGGGDGGQSTPPSTTTSSTPVTTTVTAGGTASSSSDAQPTADNPVVASVQSPVAGTITFTPVDSATAQAGYTMLGRSFVINAPAATAQEPLRLSFAVDTGALPSGTSLADLTVFRDGVPVPVCTGASGVADPDPCVTSVTTASGSASVKVLSSHASTWTFGVKSETGGNRIAGNNRYETAAQIATAFGTANAVVLANGTNAKGGADALAANYLAGRVGAPILLVQAGRVESQVLAAVKSVLKGAADPTVYVLGGVDAVSGAVASEVQKAAESVASGTVKVVRVAGADRYETSALSAAKAGTVANSIRFSSSATAQRTAILASGEVNADALAAGAISNAWGIPVLLTGSGALPESVAAAIKDLKITQLIVLGGTDRVSAGALDQAKAAGVTSVKRIAGANRFATAAALYGFVFNTAVNADGEHYGTGSSGGSVYLANGVTGFPDALSVGPLAGKSEAALLTTGPGTLASPAAKFLSGHAAALTTAIALGKAPTLAASVLAAAQKAVG
jgi:putative cell wall-binding protein